MIGRKNDITATKNPIEEKSCGDKFFAKSGDVRIEIGRAIRAEPKYKDVSFILWKKIRNSTFRSSCKITYFENFTKYWKYLKSNLNLLLNLSLKCSLRILLILEFGVTAS